MAVFVTFVILVRVFSILIFIVMVLVQTPVSQLFKITELIEHYAEHRNLDEHMSFSDFLAMHYSHSDVQYPDHERDMQLPFKQYNCSSLVFTFSQPAAFALTDKTFFARSEEGLTLYWSPFHSSELLANIWQPPKA
ncbi:MAG: hypothetical protein H3C54_09435 [Taibaiella sp.]|nr:hypothetical protein [Taibaiella sp.]